MAETYGVDLSTHNGSVNFEKLSKEVDFVMLRGGYSRTTDARFIENAKNCEKNGIPYGVYWFSYAFNDGEGKLEADYLLNLIKENSLKPAMPIAFDYEQESYSYAYKKGQDVSSSNICKIASAFLDTIKAHGYEILLYANVDFYNRIFLPIISKYPIWLAQWGVSSPSKACEMWQKTSSHRINGVFGNVDFNVCYRDYKANKTKTEDKIKNKMWEKYLKIAQEILKGKYGNGAERKQKLKEQGLDAEFAQDVVNYLIYG